MINRALLADHVDLLTGFPFKSANYSQDADDVRLLRGDNIIQGAIRWDNAARWPRRQISDVKQYALRPGDVVLAMDRPWIEAGLKYARIGDRDVPALLVQRVARLRARAEVDQGFLFYLIGSRAFTDHVLAVQTGTAVPHISAKQILSFEFALPPIDEQRAIAAVLGALDDKIEQNRRTERALEQLARVTFKAWFVDFEPIKAKAAGASAFAGMPAETFAALPDRVVESRIGPVPEGWALASLPQLATFLNGLALQKYPARGDGSDLPVIKIAQLRKGSSENADAANSDVPAQFVVNDGDLLFSWSGTLEVDRWFGGKGALNQHLFKVTPSRHPLWYIHYAILRHLPEFRTIASSKATTMGHIQRKHLDAAMVIVPTESVLRTADELISPIYALSAGLRIESRLLAALRDYLLPRLLTGEVRVQMPVETDGL